MRLVSIAGRIHALDASRERALDLAAATGLPAGACKFLEAGGLAAAADVVGAGVRGGVDLAAVRLDPIPPKPRVVWGIGVNYRGHAREMGREPPPVPTVFVKSPGALIAHEEPIVVPPNVTQPDYEGEVAVVIGRRARDVSEDAALDYVAGVTCAHDVSARDHQYVTGQWSWSKSFDTFCPLGPVLVTVDEVDVGNLPIETRVSGEVLQCSNTSELIFSIPRLVAELSAGVTLEPGDVILTGTPAGVGHGRTPRRYLQDGDVVEITVGGVGTLRNAVIRRPS